MKAHEKVGDIEDGLDKKGDDFEKGADFPSKLQATVAVSAGMKPETQRIAMAVAFYFSTSLCVVFLNKYVMNYADVKFPHPLFITWFQLLVALFMIVVLGEMSRSVQALSFMPRFEFSLDKAKAVTPLTIIYVAMLAMNNLCLQYVEVSFYQVVRSLNICFNIALSYYMLNQSISQRVLTSCGVVFLGYVVASYGEVNFSWMGIIYGILSSLFVSLNSIYVKKVLPAVNGDTWKLAIYNTVISIFLLFPIVLMAGDFTALRESGLIRNRHFWALNTITGVFGYLINIATFLQIKFTSPLTHTISGTAKAIVQTVLGALLFRNTVSTLNAIGNAVCIGGSAWYALIRHQEMQAGR
eukprot:tig00020965_g16829.t1